VVGAQGSPYLQKGRWQVGFGFRYQKSDRHFVGPEEQVNRETEQSQVINWIYLADFSATYGLTNRTNLSFSVPILFADRSGPLRVGGEVVSRYTTHTRNISDSSLMARTWVFDPEIHKTGNVSLGVGVKFPTGSDHVKDTHWAVQGTRFVPTVRNVDQSIQPGDGKFGMVVDMLAFKRVWKMTLNAAGTYLINPAGTNGELTGRGRASESIFSVPDQYLIRGGAAFPILPKQGIAVSMGMRLEGVPVRDLFGPDDGFRRPGYALSVDPGVLFVIKDHVFSFNAPIAVRRNRKQSVSDIADGRHGDAAFADNLWIFGYTKRF
jgi:hypothetical protein